MSQQTTCYKKQQYLTNPKKYDSLWFSELFDLLPSCGCEECDKNIEDIQTIQERKDYNEEPSCECEADGCCTLEHTNCEYCNWEKEEGDIEDDESDLHTSIKERWAK